MEFIFGDGSSYVLGPGGLARVDAATVRQIKNVGDGPALYVIAGGKDGYVGRDGRLPEGETQPGAARRRLCRLTIGCSCSATSAACVARVERARVRPSRSQPSR